MVDLEEAKRFLKYSRLVNFGVYLGIMGGICGVTRVKNFLMFTVVGGSVLSISGIGRRGFSARPGRKFRIKARKILMFSIVVILVGRLLLGIEVVIVEGIFVGIGIDTNRAKKIFMFSVKSFLFSVVDALVLCGIWEIRDSRKILRRIEKSSLPRRVKCLLVDFVEDIRGYRLLKKRTYSEIFTQLVQEIKGTRFIMKRWFGVVTIPTLTGCKLVTQLVQELVGKRFYMKIPGGEIFAQEADDRRARIRAKLRLDNLILLNLLENDNERMQKLVEEMEQAGEQDLDLINQQFLIENLLPNLYIFYR
jgi:hypothetical protein